MGQRGRKSAAELAVAHPDVQTVVLPDAPYDLTDDQAAVWRATLASLPPDWIEVGAHPALAAFCRVTVEMRRIGQMMDRAQAGEDGFTLKDYLELVKAHGAQAQVLKTLSTALRLTPQTRIRAEKGGRLARGFGGGAKRPWEA